MSGAKNNNNVAPVTVVIPCFNCRATIERAVDSVIIQSIFPASVIIVDDCSQDGTAEILQALSKKYADGWMHVIELPRNRGPGNARNVGSETEENEKTMFCKYHSLSTLQYH